METVRAEHIKQNRIVSLDKLTPHPRNYRQHPESQVAKLIASLARFGQGRSIVCQDGPHGYLIVAGHGIVEAAKQLHYIELRADILPAAWSSEQIDGYLLADNLHSQDAQDDDEMLVQLLQEQQNAGYDLASLGTDGETLRQMLESLGDHYLADGRSEETHEENEEDASLSGQDARLFSQDAIEAEAFKYFRNVGFPYRKMPLYMCMQEINKLANVDSDKFLHSNLGYHVADSYHPHRFHSSAEHMWSPYKAFYDDKRLHKTLQLYTGDLGSGTIPLDILGNLCVVSTTQACANFRPGFALHLYRTYCKPGSIVLDTSTGYGGRLIGFIASGLAGRYIGIDPNTVTHAANLRMASDLCFADSVELYNMPAEDMLHEIVVGRCDFAFTSPPYFAKEHYSDEDTQSWKRYGNGDAWRTGFLQKMLALQYAALKPGSYAIVNIADVQLRGKWYPLTQWTIEDGKAIGFSHVETLEFPLNRRFGEGHTDEVAVEPVIVFRKTATPLVEEVAYA